MGWCSHGQFFCFFIASCLLVSGKCLDGDRLKETTLRRYGAFLLALSFLCGLGVSLGFASETDDWAVTAELSDRRLLSKPKDNDTWADLVEARIQLKDFTRAAEALQIWRRNVPKVSKSYPTVERLQGDLDYSKGNLDGAIQAWQLYVQQVRKDIKGWDRLAWALERQKRISEAVEAVSGALKAKADASHYAWRARLKILLRDWVGAAADVKEGNKLDATDGEIQALFPKFERSAQWLGRMKELDAAIKANPTDFDSRQERVEWLASQDFLDTAYEDAAEAVRLNPRSLRARVWKGALAWQRGGERSEVDDVVETNWEKLERYDAHWAETLRKVDQLADPDARAKVMLALHQPVLAFKEVEAVDGSLIKPLALLELKEIPKTGEAARRAVELHPESADAWVAMARLNLVNGNPREALQNIDRCEQLNPTGLYPSLRKEAEAALGNK